MLYPTTLKTFPCKSRKKVVWKFLTLIPAFLILFPGSVQASYPYQTPGGVQRPRDHTPEGVFTPRTPGLRQVVVRARHRW
jgi:hypothetical protein